MDAALVWKSSAINNGELTLKSTLIPAQSSRNLQAGSIPHSAAGDPKLVDLLLPVHGGLPTLTTWRGETVAAKTPDSETWQKRWRCRLLCFLIIFHVIPFMDKWLPFHSMIKHSCFHHPVLWARKEPVSFSSRWPPGPGAENISGFRLQPPTYSEAA